MTNGTRPPSTELHPEILAIWRWQVDSYWTRTSYFALFATGVFTAAATLYIHDHCGLAAGCGIFGLLLSVCWWLNNKRTHEYVRYWWRYLGALENDAPQGQPLPLLPPVSGYNENLKRFGKDPERMHCLPYHVIVQTIPFLFFVAFSFISIIGGCRWLYSLYHCLTR